MANKKLPINIGNVGDLDEFNISNNEDIKVGIDEISEKFKIVFDKSGTRYEQDIGSPTVVVDSVSTSISVSPNENTIYEYGTLDSLTITSIPVSHKETVIYFSSGATATVLALPVGFENISIGSMVVSANGNYILSIQNGLIIMGGTNR